MVILSIGHFSDIAEIDDYRGEIDLHERFSDHASLFIEGHLYGLEHEACDGDDNGFNWDHE